VVGATALVAVSAVGFTVGVILPSRFTPLLVAMATFLLAVGIRSASPYALLWPGAGGFAASPSGGPPSAPADTGVFYHYLPDLSIAQVMFLAGVTVVALGVLGLLRTADNGWRLRGGAAVLAAAGLAAAGTAAGLIGTARQGAYGVVIPALHDAASDRPVPYIPACSQDGTVPVCLHPAYRAYLPVVTAAAAPLLSEIAGLPGAPVRVEQVANDALTPNNGSMVWWAAGSAITGTPAAFRFPMPQFPPGSAGRAQLTETVQETLALTFVNDERLIPPGTQPGGGVLAQEAVEWALLQPFDPQAEQDIALATPDSQAASPAVAAAAKRFAALSPGARRTWLAAHLPALRAGRVTLAQLP
jgi:hypothetical protein